MKISKYLTICIISIISLFVIISSCSKNEMGTKDSSETSELNVQKDVSSISAIKTVECIGSCTNGNECFAWVRNGNITCSCSGCVLSVEEGNPSNRSMDSKADLSGLLNYFVNYVERIHTTETYGILSFKHSFYDNSEFIVITYFIDGNPDVIYTVSFLIEYDSSGESVAKTTLVDCSGSCPNDSCVEIYNMNSGSVSCGCQSDECTITIEELTI